MDNKQFLNKDGADKAYKMTCLEVQFKTIRNRQMCNAPIFGVQKVK